MEFNAVFLFANLDGATVNGKVYDYKDNLSDGSRGITFPSQFVWKTRDVFLQDESVNTYVFIRKKRYHKFQFAGKVTDRVLVTPRTKDTQLIMRFTLDPTDHSVCFPDQVFSKKISIYDGLQAMPTIGKGIQEGIVPVHISNL